MGASFLNSAVPVQVVPTSMITKVTELAISKQIVSLDWHIVTGSAEIPDLERLGVIRPLTSKDRRYSLFLEIKYPDHKLYQAKWGPELLHFDREPDPYLGRCGRVWATYPRYSVITEFILAALQQEKYRTS